ASAGASWTVSPSFTSTLLVASQVRGRRNAAMAEPMKMIANTPSTSRRCLKTAERKLRTASVLGALPLDGRTGVAAGRGWRGPMGVLGVGLLAVVVQRVADADARQGRDEAAHVEVDHLVHVADPRFGHEDHLVGAQPYALRDAVLHDLLEVHARGLELAV